MRCAQTAARYAWSTPRCPPPPAASSRRCAGQAIRLQDLGRGRRLCNGVLGGLVSISRVRPAPPSTHGRPCSSVPSAVSSASARPAYLCALRPQAGGRLLAPRHCLKYSCMRHSAPQSAHHHRSARPALLSQTLAAMRSTSSPSSSEQEVSSAPSHSSGSSSSSSLLDSSRIGFTSRLARRASTVADGDGAGTSSSLLLNVLFSQAETSG